MTGPGALFDRAATSYDGERRALVPGFDGFYGAALTALEALPPRARVLDLGAGTGLLSGLFAAGRPDVRLTLVDIAGGMLDAARQRFAVLCCRTPTYVIAAYSEAMPEGPFEAVISALSIHHLDDAAKARVHVLAFARLVRGGVFVNAEQVAGETPEAEAALDAEWEATALSLGASRATVARARERMAHDRHVPEATNMALLRQAGFIEVAMTFRLGRFAVFAGRKP